MNNEPLRERERVVRFSPENGYAELIRKLSRRRLLYTLLFIALYLLFFFFSSSFYIDLPFFYYAHVGWPLFPTVLLFLLLLFCNILAFSSTVVPIHNALFIECDPQKFLELSLAFRRERKEPSFYLIGLFLLGDFPQVIVQEKTLSAGKNKGVALDALFYSALAGYLLGDFDAMHTAMQRFDALSVSFKGLKMQKACVGGYVSILSLVKALHEEDEEKAKLYTDITPWDKNTLPRVLCDFFCGEAALLVGDKEECFFRMKRLQSDAPKSVFARLANDFLKDLTVS